MDKQGILTENNWPAEVTFTQTNTWTARFPRHVTAQNVLMLPPPAISSNLNSNPGLPPALLLQPQASQVTINSQCLACGKPLCQLKSHRQYTQDLEKRLAWIANSDIDHTLSSELITNPRIDPFARYPIRMSMEEHQLLDSWARPWGSDETKGPERHLFPRPNLEVLYPVAMKVPIVLRAALALVASQRSLYAGKVGEAALYQQRKVAQLHIEMNQNPERANCDENILAGLTIMSNHMSHGGLEDGIRLMAGVNAMVKARGGLHNLGVHGAVAGYVMYADHVNAICQVHKPVWDQPLPSLAFPGDASLRIGSGFRNMVKRDRLVEKLCTAAIDLCRATDVLDLGFHRKATIQQLQTFNYLCVISEYQLAVLNAEYMLAKPAMMIREACIVLVLLLFNEVILRNCGAIPAAARVLEERFWRMFKSADTAGLWKEEDQYFLIWLLITPLVVAVRGPCRYTEYATQRLQEAQRRVRIRDFEHLKQQSLVPYIWFSPAQEELLRDIWVAVNAVPVGNVKN